MYRAGNLRDTDSASMLVAHVLLQRLACAQSIQTSGEALRNYSVPAPRHSCARTSDVRKMGSRERMRCSISEWLRQYAREVCRISAAPSATRVAMSTSACERICHEWRLRRFRRSNGTLPIDSLPYGRQLEARGRGHKQITP